ncbi:MAG: rhodanese-like domain-containing protein [Phycisphaerae bacterium]
MCTRTEYEISHLHHARWIHADESKAKAMVGVPHDRPLVAYCSVGYRSSAYRARLIKDGLTNVHDLQGSIFQLANAALPEYRDGKIAHHVRPHNHHWGQLFRWSLWAFHPPVKKH